MIGSDLYFFFVVKLSMCDCFCANQTYPIVSSLIMAGLEPEKQVFFTG